MRIVLNPPKSEWDLLVKRKAVDYQGIRPRVEAILAAVSDKGDAALRRLMKEIDGVEAPLEVSREEIARAGELRRHLAVGKHYRLA